MDGFKLWLFLGSGDHILEDVAVKERELFISDATDEYPVSAIKWVAVFLDTRSKKINILLHNKNSK